MKILNTNKRQHAIFNCGFEYKVPRGEVAEIPDRIGLKMLARNPELERWYEGEEQKKRVRKKIAENITAKKVKRAAKRPTIELAADKQTHEASDAPGVVPATPIAN